MGIRFYCPKGHKLNVKEFQAGRRGICPYCSEKILIPTQSSRPSSKEERQARRAGTEAMSVKASSTSGTPSTGTAVAQVLPSRAIVEEELHLRDPEGEAEPSTAVAESSSLNGFQTALQTTPAEPVGMISPANSVPDPLADSAEVVWYVRPPTGGQFGPAAPEIVRGWLAEGRISSDTLVWREGWRDWLEAGSVFPQLNPTYLDPMAALNNPVPVEMIPHALANVPMPTQRGPSLRLLWIIAGILTALIAVLGIVLWKLHG